MPQFCEACKSSSLRADDFADPRQFTVRHDEWLIRENIAQLRQLMSDQNLQLLPDYEQRIEVLKDLGFIDNLSRVELKGKVACEVGRPCIFVHILTDELFRSIQLMSWS